MDLRGPPWTGTTERGVAEVTSDRIRGHVRGQMRGGGRVVASSPMADDGLGAPTPTQGALGDVGGDGGTPDATSPVPETTPRQPIAWRWWAVVGAVTVVGLAIRIVYVWSMRRGVDLIGDPVYYHKGANLLAEGKGFLNPFQHDLGNDVQAADHPPLYTAYLAMFSLIGIKSVTGHLVASCLLGAAAVPLAAGAGREMLGRRVGIIAAVLVAVYPQIWRYDGMVLSETMVIVTTLATLWLAYRCWRHPSLRGVVWVAVAVAFAALARSELLLLAPLLVIPLGVSTARRTDTAFWKPLGAAALAGVVVLGPWVGHNLTRFDRPVFLSGQLEVTLAVANCESTYYGEHIGYWDYTCGQKLLDAHGPVADEAEANEVQLEGTLEYMGDHARRIPLVVAARIGRIVGVYQPMQQLDIDSYVELFPRGVMVAANVAYWILVPFSIAGVVLLRKRRVPIYILLSVPIAVLITVVVIYASMRFRAAAEGPMCLAAAVAIGAVLHRWWPDRDLAT